VLTAAKSFQRQAMGGSNERRQPFFGCSLDANAFSLIPKEFYLIDETSADRNRFSLRL